MTSRVNIKTKVEITATLELDEGQLKALNAMVGYGDNAFLKAFYVKLGKAYMQPFERDLRSLFANIRQNVPHALREIEKVKHQLKDIK